MQARTVFLIVLSIAFAALDLAQWLGALPSDVMGYDAGITLRIIGLVTALLVGLIVRDLWEEFWIFALVPTLTRLFLASPQAPAKFEQNLYPLVVAAEIIYLLLLAAAVGLGYLIAKSWLRRTG